LTGRGGAGYLDAHPPLSPLRPRMGTTEAPGTEAAAEATVAPLWLVFACDGRRFALPLAEVREIVAPQPFTRLPGCGPEVLGLVGLHGRAITAFDLGAVLGLRPSCRTRDHRLLLVEHGARVLGLVVDSVDCTRAFELSDTGTPDADDDAANFRGVAEIDGARVSALATDRVFGRLLA
jgi:chemotaxis signal transduction protein